MNQLSKETIDEIRQLADVYKNANERMMEVLLKM